MKSVVKIKIYTEYNGRRYRLAIARKAGFGSGFGEQCGKCAFRYTQMCGYSAVNKDIDKDKSILADDFCAIASSWNGYWVKEKEK